MDRHGLATAAAFRLKPEAAVGSVVASAFRQKAASGTRYTSRQCVASHLSLLLASAALAAQPATYDLVLRNGRIVDGTGSPWYRADVAIKGDTIVRIAPSIRETAARTIDVSDLVVAPGFIDIHTHARRGIFEVPTADNYVRQGVTTLVEGPDGSSPLPLRPFFEKLAATRFTPNFASFVGQGSIRSAVIGEVNRPATSEELEKMRELVRQGWKTARSA